MSAVFPLRSLPIRVVRRLLRGLQSRLAPRSSLAGARSSLWAAFHYTAIDRAFTREQKSFLAGRAAYHQFLNAPKGTSALLRRNVHRLEKGLLMKPRRVPFAREYIGETVAAFIAASKTTSSGVDPTEVAWANDVLSEYFNIHSGFCELHKLSLQFESVKSSEGNSKPLIPYRRDLSAPPPVTFEALAALAKRRRSVRWFLPCAVERHLLDKALEVGAQAPSACNRQPFQYRFFDDPDVVNCIINIPFGLAGYGHQVPVIAVVTGQQRHFFHERDRHLIYIDASLSVMGFLFALESLGLASCCVNWPDIEENERQMAELLNLTPDERPVMLIALGYPDPDGMVANSTKKSLQQLRRFNFE